MTDQQEDQTIVEEAHGFFQFIGQAEELSDSDDNSIFGTPRQRKKPFDIKSINYTPKLDEDSVRNPRYLCILSIGIHVTILDQLTP